MAVDATKDYTAAIAAMLWLSAETIYWMKSETFGNLHIVIQTWPRFNNTKFCFNLFNFEKSEGWEIKKPDINLLHDIEKKPKEKSHTYKAAAQTS